MDRNVLMEDSTVDVNDRPLAPVTAPGGLPRVAVRAIVGGESR